MARILYLVAGEGNGHATRSAAVIEQLQERGHEIATVSDGTALGILERQADQVLEAVTPHIVYRDNEVRGVATLWRNLMACPQFARDVSKVKGFVRLWKPEVMVSDFNPMASCIRQVPLISIDNQGVLSHGKIEVPRGYWWEYVKSRMVCAAVSPWAAVRVVSSFAEIPVRLEVVKVGPIVAKQVRALKPRKGRQVVVYQTSPSHVRLAELLPELDVDVCAYGFGREGKVGKVRFKAFDRAGWYRDLASCRAVVMNGGYSLMTEALVLGKPVLCFPIMHQFEQVLNAYCLEQEGLGVWGREVSVEQMSRFLEKEDVIRMNLKRRVWSDGAAQAAHVVDDVLRGRMLKRS